MPSLFAMDDVKVEAVGSAGATGKPGKKKGVSKKIITHQGVRLGKRYQAVSDAIGPVRMGESIHYASMGEWSTHELMAYLLDQIGPAHLALSTWSVSENAIRVMIDMFQTGQLKSLVGVLDWRVKVRRPAVFSLMQFNFAEIRLVNSHAKVFVLENDDFQVAVVGSANFTNNPRIEAGVIACDESAAAFHRKWIELEFERADPFEQNVEEQTC